MEIPSKIIWDSLLRIIVYFVQLPGDYWYTMPPKEITHSQILPSDVLSILPPNVIDNILLRLPCKDAVRTSILSTEWRYHWCRLTELTLDESLWSADEDLKFCYQFITCHEGSIFKFTLDISDLRGFPEIDNFIYYLFRNGITHLVLHLPEYVLFKLPSSVFRCSQLTHLNLQESHCPLLEKLVWFRLDDGDSVDINAPMLKSFDFTGVISSVCLKNVPRLLKVSLTGFDMSAQHLDFAKVFKSCPALEHLLINFSNFAVYSAKDDNRILESLELEHFSDMTLNYLREVELKCYAGTPREMQLIKLLLAKSPVLVKMLIYRRSGLLETRVNLFDEVFDIYFLLMNEFSNVSFLSHSDARYVAVMNSIFSAQHIMLLGDYYCMMPPTGRECRQGLPLDVLNDLPDNVIDIIVMSLPFKDAVRTSVLSRKWRKDIQHLVLRLSEHELYKLPSSLFICSQLTHLNLHNCSINHPLACEGFPRLVSLELCNVTISSESLGSLISHCLLLEKLVLKISETVNLIPINAPMLRSFEFTGRISSLWLKNVSLLAKVMEADDRGIQESLELERFSDVTFNHLREVTLVHFGGTTPEMQLIKLLLAKSLVLVKVQIYPALYVDSSSDTLAEILKFRHASPKVEIDYVSR
ncbi:hypothetical protein CQW23_27468 [Capsicum baccatum]|uniref:F-box domain-containing protein n=1 Tax=Capsicum baccatum TaxID=33114 RepID=A0A2G2VDQ5_CAPBA|nr:hypothetical protein CQW23_27468 [Capsicum baccatum]